MCTKSIWPCNWMYSVSLDSTPVQGQKALGKHWPLRAPALKSSAVHPSLNAMERAPAIIMPMPTASGLPQLRGMKCSSKLEVSYVSCCKVRDVFILCSIANIIMTGCDKVRHLFFVCLFPYIFTCPHITVANGQFWVGPPSVVLSTIANIPQIGDLLYKTESPQSFLLLIWGHIVCSRLHLATVSTCLPRIYRA